MQQLRVFISSPGDVAEERLRADLIVDKLSQEYSRFFEIKGYRWDHEPMLASGHFQDAIEPPSKFDIVVLILWSRLGTALPTRTSIREYHGADGRVPVTGTEWEYEDALRAARETGAPDLLAFRNISRAPIDPRAPEAQVAQLDALNAFWRRHFVDRGIFLAAYEEFQTLEQFAIRLEESLRKLIDRRIRAQAKGGQAAVWPREPFRGLQSYDFEHAPIFFGRDGLITKAIERLAGNAAAGTAFLLVSGASGSGKSSVVKAGVVPRLMRPQRVPSVAFLRATVMRPATVGADLVLGLARALTTTTQTELVGLPELIGPGQDVHTLSTYLRSSASAPGFAFSNALGRVTEVARKDGRLLAYEEAKLILVVDQLEEIVTVPGIDDRQRQLFIALLAGLARSGLVWVVATLRDDFWARVAQISELAALADGNCRLDVGKPSAAELADMISKPALVAGLTFQPHPTTNITLDRILAEEAAAAPGVLPLLSFTLDELYKDARRRNSTQLTYQHYEAIGRLEGAIANRAEAVVGSLSPAAKATLPRVLRALAAVGADGRVIGRTTTLTSFAEGEPARILIDAFIDARLLVATSEQGAEVVRLAHEALIGRWQRALDQLTLDRRDLETRTVVEAQHQRWSKSANYSKNQLLLRDPDLANAIELSKRWGDELDPVLRHFIQTSRNRVWLRQGLAAIATTVFGMVAIAAFFAVQQAERAREQSQISQLVALAQSDLREGHTRQAIEQAAHAFEQSPSFETRSALLPALLTVSPYMVGQLDLTGGYSSSMTWISSDTLAYATTQGEVRFLNALRRSSDQPMPAEPIVVGPRAGQPALLVVALRLIAAGRVLAVLQDGSIATIGLGGGNVQLRPAATPIDVRPSPQGAAISRDGSHIVLATTGGGPRLLTCNGSESMAACSDVQLAPTSVSAVEFSPAGDRVALGTEDGKVQVVSLFGVDVIAPIAVGFPVVALAWNPTRDRLTVGGADGNMVIYDLANAMAKEVGRASMPKHLVNAIDWNPTGDQIVFACEQSVLCVARVSEDGAVEPAALRFSGHSGNLRKAAFAADGIHVVSSDDIREVSIWSTNPDRRVSFELTSSITQPVLAIAYGSVDRRLAAAHSNGEVSVWNTADALTRDPSTSVRAQTHLKGLAGEAKAIAWRTDGVLAVGYQDGRKIALWPRDLKPGPRVGELPAAPLQIAFQRDGSRLLALAEDDHIYLAKFGDSIALHRVPWSARAFVINPLKDMLYASRGAGEIAVWDLVSELNAPSLRVDDPVAALGLAVSPDGRLLAATGGDQFVKIFDVNASKLLTRLPLTLATQGQETRGNVAFSTDGGFLACLGADGRVYIWQLKMSAFSLFVVVGSAAETTGSTISPGDYNAAVAWVGSRTLAIVDKRGVIRIVNLDTEGWQARRGNLYFRSP